MWIEFHPILTTYILTVDNVQLQVAKRNPNKRKSIPGDSLEPWSERDPKVYCRLPLLFAVKNCKIGLTLSALFKHEEKSSLLSTMEIKNQFFLDLDKAQETKGCELRTCLWFQDLNISMNHLKQMFISRHDFLKCFWLFVIFLV